ncbi:PilZ domain-containing protein [Aestuariirhabdus litorea]|uniref:Cyclic diguanosine monophosphate-binding protein n=1 Tax=Aestuariirhabdus litorea TaxID=2528527 RepID=A0A3P3VLG7_9GAMM|nr:PilZ domain-containing protein [Aestuariirhabdus litorea]RRJ83591.1 PilZ domain-containing protein [Aestuariirhabdus litorea]RWW96812.1 PilZ domain-containing protein [Endozoicomonadaceae bacterium GTF-13]
MSSGDTPTDRRHFTRFAFDADSVISQEGKRWPVSLVDISLNGVLVRLGDDCDLSLDSPCKIDVNLDSEHQIEMLLEFAHERGGLTGFSCCQIDLDSITLLKRLAELNLGDHQLLERELSALSH